MKKRLLYFSMVLIVSWLVFVSLPFKWVPEQGWLNNLYHASWGIFFDIGIGDTLDNKMLPSIYTFFVDVLDSLKNLDFKFWGGIFISFCPAVGLIILSRVQACGGKKRNIDVSEKNSDVSNDQDEKINSDNDNISSTMTNREDVIFEKFKKFLDSSLSNKRENVLRVLTEIEEINLTDSEEERLYEMMLEEAWIREGALSQQVRLVAAE